MQKVILAGLAALLLGPATCLMGVALLMNPAAQASCLPPAGMTVGAGLTQVTADLPKTSRVVFPLPSSTWVRTSSFGSRVHPITGVRKLHTGVDFAAPPGTPILAAADGQVAFAGPTAGFGNLVLIEHTFNGQRVATGYAHMTSASILVRSGDVVSAGQHIAGVGSTGYATGPHLHFEVRPGGANAAPIDPEPWLAGQGAVNLDGSVAGAGGGCAPGGEATPYDGTNPNQMVADPTTDGKITARAAHVLAQVITQFPSTAWSCFSPRPGQPSEHTLGRACDGTFGNSIGYAATGPALDLGWRVTNWMKSNADTLGVEYLIWQGRIWSVARSSEGWRAYNGGGMFDPKSVTGGHFDHLHFTVLQE